jgi:GNAT superfamily N-acetyltransferase
VVAGFATYGGFAPPGWRAPDRLALAIALAGRLRDPVVRGWVAEDGDGVVGHVTYVPATHARRRSDEPGLAHLGELFVRPARFGTGVAAELLAVAVEDAARRGFSAIRLFTPLHHARARRFYEREGWRAVGGPVDGEPIGLALIEYRRGLRDVAARGDGARGGSGSRATG